MSELHSDPDRDATVALINAGSDIAGSVVGAAVGLFFAGPAGALAGAAGGPLLTNSLKKLGADIHRRWLSPREQTRIGGVIAFAAQRIKEKLDNGEHLRSDRFFASELDSRPAVEEIYEGVILAAQREHEEKKLPFMGNLMANLAFRPDIDRGYANFLVRLAEELSYRQLGLILLFASNNKTALRQSDYDTGNFPPPHLTPTLTGVLHECLDLAHRALIITETAAFVPQDISPGKTSISGAAHEVLDLMELSKLPPADIGALVTVLS